ncbi:hypothetical protein D3C84_709220 [compost metagenome]
MPSSATKDVRTLNTGVIRPAHSMNNSTIAMEAIDELDTAANNKNTDEPDEVLIKSARKE